MDNRVFCVYCHTNLTNGKKYIGQTCNKPENRWSNGNGYKTQTYFYNAIQKYGWDGFRHEILFDGLTQEEANFYEIKMIAEFNSTNPNYGYNITSGGNILTGESNPFYGKHHTEETKAKMSASKIGKYTGKNNPNYGNHKLSGANSPFSKRIKQYDKDGNFIAEYSCIPEAVSSLGLNTKGRSISRNCNQNSGLSFGFIWIYSGEEYRLEEKIKNAIYKKPTGEDNPMFGKKLSDERRAEISKATKGKNNPSAKRVAQYTIDGELVRIWDYCKEAADFLQKPYGTGAIVSCAHGRQKTAYGYVWRYV